jgi:hypothetical protein
MDLDLDDVRALQALQTRRANVEAGTAAFAAPGYFANPVAGYNFMNRNQGPDFDIRGRDLSPAEVALLRQYRAANAATTDAYYGTAPTGANIPTDWAPGDVLQAIQTYQNNGGTAPDLFIAPPGTFTPGTLTNQLKETQ